MAEGAELSRRDALFGGALALGTVGFGSTLFLAGQNAAPPPDVRPPATAPLVEGGVVARLTFHNDFSVAIQLPTPMTVPMQTNGRCLCIETTVDVAGIDLRKILVDVSDAGHQTDAAVVQVQRRIALRDVLHGPYSEMNAVTGGPRQHFFVLDDAVFNESEQWRSQVSAVYFLDGWLTGRTAETIPGELVERQDKLRYPPFPVKTASLPFRRMEPGGTLSFEVATMNEFARHGSQVARVEAWAKVFGMSGPIASATAMTNSAETPAGSPSGLPVPVYAMAVSAAGLLDGAGEIFYKVYPWIGPSWSSEAGGEVYPTLNAPRALPFCNDPGGSYAPVFGIVGQDGLGLPGTDLRGLSLSLDGAKAVGLKYRDCAAVATAVRSFNAATTPQTIAEGSAMRATAHNDIAGGIAVLLPIDGSILGGNAGSYALRTGFASQAIFPPGLTPFEIRSETGLPDPRVRLRGVLPSGAAPNVTTKHVPSRLLLRGVWLDGTGVAGAGHSIIDGTTAAGASTAPLSALAAAYQMTIDCVITENPAAGSASPIRLKPGYVWDVRLRHDGVAGLASLHTVTTHSGLVATIGSLYANAAPQNGLILSTVLGCRFRNIAVKGQLSNAQPEITGMLILNVRIDFDRAFTTPMIGLVSSRPARGGLGIGNVFLRGGVDSGGPGLQIGADGTMRICDNLILRHLGLDMPTATSASNGRANVMYQDQGYVRIDKVGTLSYCAFRCYTIKGDVFPAPEKPTGTSWLAGASYSLGSIVFANAGAATAASVYYQAVADAPAGTSLADNTKWALVGQVFSRAYGAQPLRQGNAAVRYHIGCRGNVASVTYNGAAFPGTASGFGFIWGADENAGANYAHYYRNPVGNDYAPKSIAAGDALDSPLLNRVAPGYACFPFDLGGAPRLNDGTGAAGAYERLAGPPTVAVPKADFVTQL